jgi:hypothetical protein
MRRAAYKGEGREERKYGMGLISWILFLFFLKHISICMIKV